MKGSCKANLVDIERRHIFPALVEWEDGIIKRITQVSEAVSHFILPGFVDAHIHIESSLMLPSEFARMAVIHGTVATVSDPHEIANVLGVKGVNYMIENGKRVPFHFNFGAPSCVPATTFETAGAEVTLEDIHQLLSLNEVRYLSEMMNFPGVLHEDAMVMDKIALAKNLGKPVDGHAPGLMGDDARKYASAGISTDHECVSLDEALHKISCGMKILIREGSAAKNFEALCSLLQSHPDDVMLCSDDKHPDSLLLGHINHLVVRAVTKGYDVFNVLKAACINPVQHYSLPCGILREGDSADFIMVNNLSDFDVIQTYVRGLCVADSGHSLISGIPTESINFFHSSIKKESDFEVDVKEDKNWVIACMDGQLLTHKLILPKSEVSASNDVVRLAVVNRYHDSPVATAFIKGTGIKKGAIASSVAHDSHNIVVAGVDAKSMARAVNSVMNNKGGLSAICDDEELVMPLPVAGLMSNEDAWQVAESYTRIHQFAIDKTGTTLSAPFMTLSFMALLVIPHLKLSDKGLFDGDSFRLL